MPLWAILLMSSGVCGLICLMMADYAHRVRRLGRAGMLVFQVAFWGTIGLALISLLVGIV